MFLHVQASQLSFLARVFSLRSENKVVLSSLSLFGDIPGWGMVRVTRLPAF